MIPAAFIVQIVLVAKAAWLFRERYNPDALIYLRMAGYWMNGQTDLLVTGGWGPLFSWTIIPWLLIFDDHILAAHAAVAVSAVVFLFGMYRLLRAMKLPDSAVIIGTWLTAFISAGWSTIVISPDLLMGGIFCYGVSRLIDLKGRAQGRLFQWCPGWATLYQTVRPGSLFTGMIFGAAYLAKPVALPLAGLVVIALAAIHYAPCDLKPSVPIMIRSVRNRAARFLSVGIVGLGFMLIAGPWIGLVSYHYGRPTFSTLGPIQHAIMGPPDVYRDHPDHRHFYKPEAGRFTVMEDRTSLPYNFWSPFESWEYFVYQLRLIRSNAILAVRFMQSFDWLGLGLISAICGILGRVKE